MRPHSWKIARTATGFISNRSEITVRRYCSVPTLETCNVQVHKRDARAISMYVQRLWLQSWNARSRTWPSDPLSLLLHVLPHVHLHPQSIGQGKRAQVRRQAYTWAGTNGRTFDNRLMNTLKSGTPRSPMKAARASSERCCTNFEMISYLRCDMNETHTQSHGSYERL